MPKISLDKAKAVSAVELNLSAMHNGFPTSLKFLAKNTESVMLTHVVYVENDRWLKAFVDADSREVIDFTADSAIRINSNPEGTAASDAGTQGLLELRIRTSEF